MMHTSMPGYVVSLQSVHNGALSCVSAPPYCKKMPVRGFGFT